MFSYTCSHCGVKDCFDFMEECVVSIASTPRKRLTHVKGTYDGFGHVRIQVKGQDDPVIAVPEQHHWQMPTTTSTIVLLAKDIYCNGELRCHADPKAILNLLLKKEGKQQMKELNALLGGGLGYGDGYESDDEVPRFCVPEGLLVLEELTPGQVVECVRVQGQDDPVISSAKKRKLERRDEETSSSNKRMALEQVDDECDEEEGAVDCA